MSTPHFWDKIEKITDELKDDLHHGGNMTDESQSEPQPDLQPSVESQPVAEPAEQAASEVEPAEQPTSDATADAETTQGSADPEQPEQAADLIEQSAVMQPPTDSQSDVAGPGLSPAFQDPDLTTESPDSALAAEPAEATAPPKPANAPGSSIADAQPTDEAQRRYDVTDETLATCPVCQAKFTPGTQTL
jgi:hypothetical protein